MVIVDDLTKVFEIVYAILTIILTVVVWSTKVRSTLSKLTSTFISNAEVNKTMSGAEKMAMVVSWMRDVVPRIFRVIYTDEVLEKMAQNIFDDMRKYAEEYTGKQQEEHTG